MGRRGPAPKPVKLKILASNPGKRVVNSTPGGTFPRGVPNCPSWLSREAKAEWRRIVPELDAAELLAVVDRAALAAYCQAWAELQINTATIEKDGRIVEEPIQSAGGEVIGQRLKPHPAVRLQRDAFARVRSFLIEFGLSPAARSRVNITGGKGSTPGQPGDRLGAILNRVQDARKKGG